MNSLRYVLDKDSVYRRVYIIQLKTRVRLSSRARRVSSFYKNNVW